MAASTVPSDEHWRPILGYEGLYEVSDLGRVRSLPRKTTRGGVLKLQLRPDGYFDIELYARGGKSRHLVHRLVAQAFCPQRSHQTVVRHRNAKRDDNRAVNLSWGTSADNAADTVRLGRNYQAAQTHCRNSHPFDEVNTYTDRQGHRNCRTCRRESSRRYMATQRRSRRQGAA
jgi:hypothetical protein